MGERGIGPREHLATVAKEIAINSKLWNFIFQYITSIGERCQSGFPLSKFSLLDLRVGYGGGT